MSHHAYFHAGDRDAGIRAVRQFAERELSLRGTDNPDLIVFEYGLFSVEDARKVAGIASQSSVAGGKRLIALATGRIFHEAQNALLKLFEEPIEGTTLVLLIPSEGLLLPTLRSRLIALPKEQGTPVLSEPASAFLSATRAEREKLVSKLLARTKSDKEAEKQAARLEAVTIVSGITLAAYAARQKATGEAGKDYDLLLRDLDRFAPMLHDRSAPLKLIFEHLLIVMPEGLGK